MNNFACSTSFQLSKINGRSIRRLTLGMAFFFVLSVFLTSCSAPRKKPIDLGDWNRIRIEHLLDEANHIPDPGGKITFISAAFLKTPYLADTLIGSSETTEVFVLRLDGVDCFTFLDYVEALRRADDFEGFKEALRQVRYRNGRVTFLDRNHFFSTWGNALFAPLRDVTGQVGGRSVLRVDKKLNKKADGALYLPGYPVRKQVIAFIPPEAIDESVLARLQSGDYVGIYSPYPGLDVSHTGIVIKKEGKVFLRHASSRFFRKKAIDEELLPYLGGKKGLVVYRPIAVN
ncbi:MAG: DUF1460 domain-containing protein [Desulfuromusa sp.]|nr:DUF1460 domain-containing protein [Desulfuromusa sp.]